MEAKVILLANPARTSRAESTDLHSPVVPEQLFLDVLKEYAGRHIEENGLRPRTLHRYGHFMDTIKLYFVANGLQDLTLGQMRLKTMEQMRYWLQTHHHKCSLEHASRHAEMCKRAMDYAVRMEYISANPLASFRAKRDKTREVVYLEKNELEKFVSLVVKQKSAGPKKQIHLSRDIYVFQCYTGLSYGDLWTYKVIERSGREWIMNRRAKNDNPYFVPLFPEAKAIHEKYGGKLPFVNDQNYNLHLKELTRQAGINKHLTTHTARKTFACHRDAEGWSMKSISDMMGNDPAIVQKHYLAKSTRRIENELLSLRIDLPPDRELGVAGKSCFPTRVPPLGCFPEPFSVRRA